MTSADKSGEDLCFKSAIDLIAGFESGAVSPVEVISSVFERINARNPAINAFSALTEDSARTSAAAAEKRFQRGDARRLEGVPITIKDYYDVEGQITETGSFADRGKVATSDNPVVSRLRDAGAVIIGKTTMSELAWSGMSRNPVNGTTHNPWGHGLNAGASSAGAGAASAAGFGALHLGSDGAGSIRMPAHFCGIFGLKPTYGRVPYVPVSNNDYGTHIGPMTRTVADSALMLEVMAGPHHLDHTSCEALPAPYLSMLDAPMKGKKIAFSPDLGHARVDDEVADIVADAVSLIESDLQAHVEEVRPDWGPEGRELGRFFWPSHLARRSHLLDIWEDRMSPDLVACIRVGEGYSATQYLQHRKRKYAYIAEISEFMENWDYLVTPTVSVAAFPTERVRPAHWPDHDWDWLAWAEFLYPFNMSGNPAASVPCGFTTDGLPVGLQIVGRRFDDLGVLQLASAFEKIKPWRDLRPEILSND